MRTAFSCLEEHRALLSVSGYQGLWPIRLQVRTSDFQSEEEGAVPSWAAKSSIHYGITP
jgi:hypothetical protein